MAIIEIRKPKQGKRKFAYKAYHMRILGRDIGFFYSKSEAVAWLVGLLLVVVGIPGVLWWIVNTSQTATREAEQRQNALTIRESTFVCRAVEDVRRLAELAASRDDAAFEKQLQDHVAAQACKRIPAGAKAYRDGRNNPRGVRKVRLEGEDGPWWISAQ